MRNEAELRATIAKMVEPGKGVLAADESIPTITKRFKALNICRYRLRSAPCLEPGCRR